MLMEIVLVEFSPISCVLLRTFVVVPPESKFINCGTCILNTTNLTWKKVNKAFAIIIKRVVLFHRISGLLSKVSGLFYVATNFASALSTRKCTFSPNKWAHFSSDWIVFQTVTRTKWNKWCRCKTSLNFLCET